MAEPSRGPALTVDCAGFDPNGRVLLIRRRHSPFQNAYALPGGFVEAGERLVAACRREFLEETGLRADMLHLVGVFSEPGRDPRGPTVSVAFLARLPGDEPKAGSDAAAAVWITDWSELELAFDHAEIMRAASAVLVAFAAQ